MKNKEIEELLNSIDGIIKEAPDKAIYGIQIKEYKQIRNYIEQLEEENDRLKKDYAIVINDNCDYITLEKKIEQLENNRDKAIEKLVIKQMRYLNEPKYKLTTFDLEEIKNILKGDSDE